MTHRLIKHTRRDPHLGIRIQIGCRTDGEHMPGHDDHAGACEWVQRHVGVTSVEAARLVRDAGVWVK